MCYAGYIKARDPAKFVEDIEHYKLLPLFLVRATAIVLPWNEIIVGLLLILGIWTRAAALLSLLLFIVFAGAVTSAIARKLNITCGCFGSETAARVGLQTLGIDAAGLILALIAFVTSRPAKSRKARWS